jgi:hypothetical protein
MQMAVFWDVLCNFVESAQLFRGADCVQHQGCSFFIRLHGVTSQKTDI